MVSPSHLKENNCNNSAKVGMKSTMVLNVSAGVLFTEHLKYKDLSEVYGLNFLCSSLTSVHSHREIS